MLSVFVSADLMHCLGAMAHVLDSLEEVHALSDGAENDLEFLQSLLEDKTLHSLLDVSVDVMLVFFMLH